MVSLYDYNLHFENDLLGDGREAGNLFEYIESYCNNTNRPMPEKFDDVEEILKRKDFFQYILSAIVLGDTITISNMEIFPELCGNELTQVNDNELFILFCTVVTNYFQCQYNTDWEFVALNKYGTDSDEKLFIGEAKLHIDSHIELVIYSEPKNMHYDDDSMPTGDIEYIEAVHSAKNVDAEIRRVLKSKGITREYRYHKEMLSEEYSCIAAESYNISGAEVHDSDLFVYVDSLVGDTVYSDCMLVIEGYRFLPQNHLHNYLEVEPEWRTVENRSLFMTFREFLTDGCEMDEFNFDEETRTIQILGNGHYETEGSSVFCNIRLGFTKIKLFWNAEYDYFSGEKRVGAERYFLL